MSSPLDGRIRKLAREEAAALLDGAPAGAPADGPDRVTALEHEVADLRGALKQVFARLDAIGQTSDAADQESKPATRRPRKTAESSE